MQFFLDTANVDEIRAMTATGLVDGVTTNPSLIAKSGRDLVQTIKEICTLTTGPVSAEVTAIDAEGMVKEGEFLRDIADNVCVKVPLTWEGLKATHVLSGNGHPVNVTLCFSANQALLAAKAGATYVSPFIGRIDDTGADGMELIGEIRTIYDNYPELDTQILAASIRNVLHVKQSALLGADVATIPANVLQALVKHPLTDKGLAAFMADWESTGQSILP
ncbi:MAG: fructose-6-phosphate aldolase [Robiginitomaculum sp.]|nr:MAG: fructose-6-phosphate aldolase [Robiginitomaculum sp.]